MKQLFSSWKTTGGALLTAAAYCFDKYVYRTVAGLPEWSNTASTVAFILGIVIIGVFARDNDKTSEAVGAHRQES
jgi:hypothetical protein